MTVIKICGLRTIDHALAAATAGADLLGLVFAPSRRQVTVAQAVEIVAALRQHEAGQRVNVVGLFVNSDAAQINTTSDRCGLDYVQLSGDETPAHAQGIRLPVIKSLRLADTPAEEAWLTLFRDPQQDVVHYPTDGLSKPLRLAPCPLLVDAHVPGAYGGTGALADWDRAHTVARSQPLMLAGGLTPGNVAAAIRQVRPWGVDVSSGVETDGIKDGAKMRAFIAAARSVND